MTIFDPAVLRARFVAILQGVEPLVELLENDASHIIEYTEGDDIVSAIHKMKPNTMLVYIDRIYPARTNREALIHVQICAALRSRVPFAIYGTIIGGKSSASASDGQSLIGSTIHPRFLPMAIPSLERRSIPIAENTSFDFWEIVTGFTDKASA